MSSSILLGKTTGPIHKECEKVPNTPLVKHLLKDAPATVTVKAKDASLLFLNAKAESKVEDDEEFLNVCCSCYGRSQMSQDEDFANVCSWYIRFYAKIAY